MSDSNRFQLWRLVPRHAVRLTAGAGQIPAAGLVARLLAALFAALFAGAIAGGCAQSSEPGRTAASNATAIASSASGFETPPYYRVEGGPGATLLLLGTIHLGPKEGWKLSPAIESGIARADKIALEIDLRLATEESVSTVVANVALLPPGTTLASVIAPETAKLLLEEDETVTRMGFPRPIRNRMKPWFIAVGLSQSTYGESGLSSKTATEEQVLGALGLRPLISLETFEEQIRIFDELPPALQDLMLRDTVERLDEAEAEVAELVQAWRTGDEATLARLAREGIEELPELDRFYDILLGDRNRRWVAKLRPLLEGREHHGETVLVAVGALHLVGKDSLVEQLRAAGFRVEAIAQAKQGAQAASDVRPPAPRG